MCFKEKYSALKQCISGINKKKRLVFLCVTALLLLFSLVVEPLFFMQTPYISYNGEITEFKAGENGEITAFEYSIEENNYKVNGDDPRLLVGNLSHPIKYVVLEFEEVHSARTQVEVFYGNDSFSEEDVAHKNISFLSRRVVIELPEGNYKDMRVDINHNFALTKLTVSDSNMEYGSSITQPFSISRALTLFVLLMSCVLFVLYCKYRKKHERSLCRAEQIFIALCFAFYTVWTVLAPFNYAPDEAMRFDVTKFLFDNGRLPVGDELLHEHWGFSYAHLPTVLCNTLGYVFMKLASVFTANHQVLLIAARMVSVVSCTLAVYYVIKITKLIFTTYARWIMILFFALIPQYCFLASYINNDSLVLLGIAMIVYAWVLAIKCNWTYRACFVLVGGVSICALAYYNSYAWILFSVFFFIFSYFKQNPHNYSGFLKLAGIMIVLTLLIIGYSFIRHLVLYGDLLGMETSHKYGELYAADGIRPSERLSLSELGVDLKTMLFSKEYKWVKITYMSFIGFFGYMQHACPEFIYKAFLLFIAVGILGFVVRLALRIIKRQSISYHSVLFYVCILCCAVISVMLSVYNSYTTDFQPQGRYCYPALITLAVVLTKGFEALICLMKKDENRRVAVTVVCTVIVVFSVMAFDMTYVRSIM